MIVKNFLRLRGAKLSIENEKRLKTITVLDSHYLKDETMNNSFFATFHASGLLFYFLCTITLTMFCSNPLMLVFSLTGGILFGFFLSGYKIKIKDVSFYFLIFVLTVVTNPLFSHNGMTVLFYFFDNAVTFEALVAGARTALMIISVLVWSKIYSVVCTSDKIIYLFSKQFPVFVLLMSCSLRFIPLFKQRFRQISDAQKGLGYLSLNSLSDKIMFYLNIFSALVTDSLEKSVDIADSMKARGYGIKGKTAFSLYHFTKRDAVFIAVSSVLLLVCIFTFVTGQIDFYCYPTIVFPKVSFVTFASYTSFFALCMLPFAIEMKENITWKYYISKI